MKSPPGQTIRIIVFLLVIISLLALLYRVRTALLPFFLAVLLAYMLNPIVTFCEKRGLSRVQAIVATYALLGAVTAYVLLYIVPGILSQALRLAANIPWYIIRIQQLLAQLETQYSHIIPPAILRETAGRAATRALFSLQQHLTELDLIISWATLIFGNLVSLLLAPLLAAYLLRDGKELRRKLDGLIPGKYRQKLIAVLDDMNEVLSGFLHGYLLVSIIIGVLATLILALLGVRFYLLLGLVAGLTNLIPYFGPFIGAIPAMAVASFTSWNLVLKVAVSYIVLQQFEGMVISPRILGGRTGLHPLAVVFAVMAGGAFLGLPGLLLGVPVAAVIWVVVKHLV
ncbi:MAG: AI-2E family transporter [Bacillota bacterium]